MVGRQLGALCGFDLLAKKKTNRSSNEPRVQESMIMKNNPINPGSSPDTALAVNMIAGLNLDGAALGITQITAVMMQPNLDGYLTTESGFNRDRSAVQTAYDAFKVGGCGADGVAGRCPGGADDVFRPALEYAVGAGGLYQPHYGHADDDQGPAEARGAAGDVLHGQSQL
jgi:hypothetical protein